MSESPAGGAVTKDGCPVELYRRLPYLGEVETFAGVLPAEGTLLELGSGTGRMTRALLARGLRVTAVDNSPQMLAHVPDGAERVRADIETLELGRRFDAVLLASCLVNTPEGERLALLAACARHLAAGASLVFERYDLDWLARVEPGPVCVLGAIAISVERVVRSRGSVALCVRYADGEERWSHDFEAWPLDDAAMDQALAAAGFGPAEWLDPKKRWGVARRR